MNISDFIPCGKNNAISRAGLCRLTGLSDRENRKLIELARRAGERILSSASHAGYWKSNDPAEVAAFLREEDSRRTATEISRAKLRRYAVEQTGARVVPVKAHYRRVATGDLQGQQRIEVG